MLEPIFRLASTASHEDHGVKNSMAITTYSWFPGQAQANMGIFVSGAFLFFPPR
uniref:Uncharacterized protein n=1 Tax=Arundo donax TaxID=35708 RepID=A0A0A9BV54_ARUDO